LRTIWGFRSPSSSESSSDPVTELAADLLIEMWGSVADLV